MLSDPADPATTLLFDLDGTIADSFEGIANSFRYCLRQVGAPKPPDHIVEAIAGPPMLETLRCLLDEDAAQQAFRAYRSRYVDVGWRENVIFAGMDALVRDLHARGRTLAIATSKNENSARLILKHFGIEQYFTVIAGASDDMTRAAKHQVVEHAIAQVPGPYVMIGDRSHDVEGAGKFDIPTAYVRWGYAVGDESDGARWTLDTVDDLRELLDA
ncbi:HAD hydrolase-like protein [Jongsikchunia kroppenstedtii]|uniref:HAD hydrolase-like protein n=1 Tax=Jongsikchunia kroppenstedtii TaxID=1121721 RepID=UPI00039E6140|nr:HAD hydrolase-like protein [Jongsikchunia kroppenstedtii]